MARMVEALVKPELLGWARMTARFTVADAAKRVRVSEDRIREWESGTRRPSVAQLRTMAEVYQRPLPMFYLPKAPPSSPSVQDFRRLPEGGEVEISPGLELQIRRARERREVALELAGDEIEQEAAAPTISAALWDDPDRVAQQVRDHLGVTVREQIAWSEPWEALSAWKTAVERTGVLVFQASGVPVEQMRGVSIDERPLPVIIVNGRDSYTGRIFTLLHEYVHLIVDDGGICDLRETHNQGPSSPPSDIEVYCNRVAGAVLVPAQALLQQESVVAAKREYRGLSDDSVEKLAARFSVSTEVILRRLVITGIVSPDVYRSKRYELMQRRTKPSSGSVPVHRRALLRNGLRYTRLVLNAYNEERIGAGDVASYLDVKLRHLPALEQAVLSAVGRR